LFRCGLADLHLFQQGEWRNGYWDSHLHVLPSEPQPMRSKRLSSPSVKQVHQFSSPGPLQVHSAQFFKSQVPAKEPLAEGAQVLELASSAREPAIDAVSFLFSAVNLSFAAVSFLFSAVNLSIAADASDAQVQPIVKHSVRSSLPSQTNPASFQRFLSSHFGEPFTGSTQAPVSHMDSGVVGATVGATVGACVIGAKVGALLGACVGDCVDQTQPIFKQSVWRPSIPGQ
jgi:hypothetical protein